MIRNRPACPTGWRRSVPRSGLQPTKSMPVNLRLNFGSADFFTFPEQVSGSVEAPSPFRLMAGERTFQEACCEKLGIPAGRFEAAVLWHCLPPRHRFIGRLRWRFTPGYFANDLELIRAVAECTSLSDLRAELSAWRYNQPNYGFQRGVLRARLSGQRLVNLAGKLLPK